jgi:hypothetical protein
LAWTMAAAAGPVGRGVTIIKLTWTVTLAVLASAVSGNAAYADPWSR